MRPKIDMELKRQMAPRIKLVRIEAGLSQAKFAESLGITRSHENRMEQPEQEMMPSKMVLNKLCEVYNVNPEWLKTGNGLMYNDDHVTNCISTIDPNNVLINQTIDYVTLKTTHLLKVGHMDQEDYPKFFSLHGALIDLHFRMMEDIKKGCENSQPLSDEKIEAYKNELGELLRNPY